MFEISNYQNGAQSATSGNTVFCFPKSARVVELLLKAQFSDVVCTTIVVWPGLKKCLLYCCSYNCGIKERCLPSKVHEHFCLSASLSLLRVLSFEACFDERHAESTLATFCSKRKCSSRFFRRHFIKVAFKKPLFF